MLTKLLKYELYTGKGAIFAIAGAMGGLLFVTCLLHLLRVDILIASMRMLGLIASAVALMVCVVMLVLSVYNRLCGRESTLTFTIPATVHDILLSKLLSAIVLVCGTVVIIAVYWVIYALVCIDAQNRAMLIEQIKQFLSAPLANRALTLILIACLSYYCQLLLCAAIVNVPRFRDRNLGVGSGIIAWIVLSQGYGLVMVGVWAGYLYLRGGALDNAFLNDPANIEWTMGGLFIIMTIGMAIAALVYYFVAARLLTKKRSV